jgi:hypothetical protein
MPPIATALLPCQNSALGISLTLLHCYGKVRAHILALMTAYAAVDTDGLTFHLFVEFEHFLGTDTHAQAAPLTPFFVDNHTETLSQKTHLPPDRLTLLVRLRNVDSVVANIENISKKSTQIKSK